MSVNSMSLKAKINNYAKQHKPSKPMGTVLQKSFHTQKELSTRRFWNKYGRYVKIYKDIRYVFRQRFYRVSSKLFGFLKKMRF